MLALVIFAAASLASAIAPGTVTLFLTRIFAAFGAAIYTPIAALIALTISAPERRMRGLSLVVSGMSAAMIIGVPLSAYIGGTLGWRWCFGLGALLSASSAVAIYRLVPVGVPFQTPNLANFGRALRDWRLGLALAVMFPMACGTNMVSTYLGPIIIDSTGAGTGALAVVLLLIGVTGLAGNLAGGIAGDRFGPVNTLLTLLGISTAALLFLPFANGSHAGTVMLLCLWSFSAFGTNPPQQARIVSIAPATSGIALSLNATAIYIGMAMGAVFGGGVISLSGTMALAPIGAAVLTAAMAMVLLSQRMMKGHRKR